MADVLSQEEINSLLMGETLKSEPADEEKNLINLNDDEKDALGEIGNISMGTAATTLFSLLGQRVDITTPRVSQVSLNDLTQRFDDPCVTITIGYTIGIEGVNLLIIDEKDVKIITDLMMGGDGSNISGELTELHLSAICEAMNQMIGSSATSLSSMLGQKVDIEPPRAIHDSIKNLTEEKVGLNPNEKMVMISFRMTVGTLIDSEIMQIMPIKMAKQLINSLIQGVNEPQKTESKPDSTSNVVNTTSSSNAVNVETSQQTYNAAPQPSHVSVDSAPAPKKVVDAQKVEFSNIEMNPILNNIISDIEMIKDIPLQITVELGRTVRTINDILNFGEGSVIELEKLVGESLDILANGKSIARGEVVVVDENYGVRITEIVSPEKRLS